MGLFKWTFKLIRKIILLVIGIGLPIFIYFGFIADKPVFDPEFDVEIGRQSVSAISQDTISYPILPRDEHPEVYAYINKMVKEITTSPEIQYEALFKYDSIQIIHQDDVLNAFCTPGGYIYVYTGLMQYLDRADDLAGVLGHEIAHAELRHSAVRLQKEFGREKILDFLLVQGVGLSALIKASILKEMLSLDYSRDQEAAADEYSVRYLKDTDYACNGAAGFFEKLVAADEDVNIPEFLSDHPDSKSRILDINKTAEAYQCNVVSGSQEEWVYLKSLLPEPKKSNAESNRMDTKSKPSNDEST